MFLLQSRLIGPLRWRKCHSFPRKCSLLSLWQSVWSRFVKSGEISALQYPSKALVTSHLQCRLGGAWAFDKADDTR